MNGGPVSLRLPFSLLASFLDGLFPKSIGVGDPAFGTCTGADPEAMAQDPIFAILDLGAGFAQSRNTPLHGGRRSDSVLLADDKVGGSLDEESEWAV